ncbi:hypothetical protein ERJ75_001754600 [Trypanosoma vivax]|uniref:Rhodanese domain-containing protein n=1 Tax=Trypanosoma vivax (strain Y486) TaxID=1055687 RepID=G0U2D7_TRYVY|nr:hypothetical protein ERJ75_001754600 [Trypanosoma vivax]CCC50440.1 conserved hypothetical protein [Trypanosoma vivax Y486]
MAQWIPKTAWKVSNLNKRYGPSYDISGLASSWIYGHTGATFDGKSLRERLSRRGCSPIIDLRDCAERSLYPVEGSVALHHHDLLSGAACPILPQKKESAELYVLASSEQKGVNAVTALRRWGYDNVIYIDYNTLVEVGCVPNGR